MSLKVVVPHLCSCCYVHVFQIEPYFTSTDGTISTRLPKGTRMSSYEIQIEIVLSSLAKNLSIKQSLGERLRMLCNLHSIRSACFKREH